MTELECEGTEPADIMRYDRAQILDEIVELYQDNTEECGFVKRAELEGRFEDEEVKFIHRDGKVVSALDYHHLERHHYTKVYHTVVREGFEHLAFRERLIDRVLQESPHGHVISKVPAGVDENSVWERLGGEKMRTETGRKRDLNVWSLVDNSVPGVFDY